MRGVILACACFIFWGPQLKAQDTLTPLFCTYMVNGGFADSVTHATVTFTNTTQFTGTGLSWTSAWNFGDGTTGSGTTTSHTYNAPGTYTVRLVQQVYGTFPTFGHCSDTLYKQVTTNVYPCSVNGLTSGASPHNRTVTFTRGVTENPQFTYTYLWNFGDGDTSTQLTPVHTYAADGTYTVDYTQTAVNTFDTTYVCAQTSIIHVTAKDWCATISPQIEFDSQVGAHTTIDATPGSCSCSLITQHWDFGDPNSTADTANTTWAYPYTGYVYPANGTYVITMTATASGFPGGVTCSYPADTMHITITGYSVCDSLHASFTDSIDNNMVYFTNTSQTGSAPPNYFWNLGNGLTSTSTDISYLYPSLGTQNVTLILRDLNFVNCADTITQPITVSNYGYPPTQRGLHTIDDGFLKYDPNSNPLNQIYVIGTSLPPYAATYEMWYYACYDMASGLLFSTQSGGQDCGSFEKMNNGSLNFQVNPPSSTSVYTLEGAAGYTTGGWHHLAIEIYIKPGSLPCDGGQGRQAQYSVYYDGAYGGSNSTNNMCFGLGSYRLSIGAIAYIDEFTVTDGRKYNGASFTPSRVNGVGDANTLAIYHFDTSKDSILPGRSVFYNSATDTFDLVSVAQYGRNNATEVTGASHMIAAGHGYGVRDSVCVGDTITFGLGGPVFPGGTAGLRMIGNNKAIAVVPDTTIGLSAYMFDTLSCLQIFDTLQLHIFPLPVVSAGVDTFVCLGDSIALNAIGGGSYLWNQDNYLSSLVINNPLAFPVATRNFICTITDPNGCKAKDTVQVIVKALPALAIDFANTDTLICSRQIARASLDSALTGTGIIAWNILNPLTNSVYNETYLIDSSQLLIVSVTDSNQCVKADTAFVHALTTPTILPRPDTAICLGNGIRLHTTSNATYNIWNGNIADSSIVYPDSSRSYTLLATDSFRFNYAPHTMACTTADTFNLTVWQLPVINPMADTTICKGNGVRFSEPGNNTVTWSAGYTNGQLFVPDSTTQLRVTVTDSNACISRDTVLVTVKPNPAIQHFNDTVLCAGNSVQFTQAGAVTWNNGYVNGTIINPVANDTLIATATDTITGCFSRDTVVAGVLAVYRDTINKLICQGQTYFAGGLAQSTSGTYYDTLNTIHGCDSITVTNLTVATVLNNGYSTVVCAGGVYNFNGRLLLAGGTYVDTLTAIGGCDSVVTLTLTVTPFLTTSITDSVCAGGTYNFNGHQLALAGSYIDTLTTPSGCDSVITLTLTITPALTTSINDSICAGGNYNFNGRHLTLAGIYADTLTTAGGCDSIVTLNLVVNPLPVIVALADTAVCTGSTVTLAATSTGSSIAWQGGYSNLQSVTINSNAQFIVTATDLISGCIASDSVTVTALQPTGTMLNRDTTICISDVVALTAHNGASFNWAGSVSGNISTDSIYLYTVTGNEQISVLITDAHGCLVTDSFAVTVLPQIVWPGDANDDSVVNNFDILAIGIAYGSTGPVRPNASTTWQPQCTYAWTRSFPNGVNYAQADCNGDGVIDDADTLVVLANYGLTKSLNQFSRAGNINLQVVTDRSSYVAGDTVTGYLLLGNSVNTANNIYGLAYTIGVCNAVKPNTFSISQSASWLVPTGNRLEFMRPVGTGGFEMAQSRISHTNASGYGKIATFSYIVNTGVTDGTACTIDVTNVLCVNNHNDTIGVNTISDTVTLSNHVNGINQVENAEIKVYPNPTTGLVIVEVSGAVTGEIKAEVYDELGQKVLVHNLTGATTVVNLSSFASGIYILKVADGGNALLVKRICLTR